MYIYIYIILYIYIYIYIHTYGAAAEGDRRSLDVGLPTAAPWLARRLVDESHCCRPCFMHGFYYHFNNLGFK